MTYVLPKETIVYGPGDFFFESGDIHQTVFNKTDAPMVHVLFEILPVELRRTIADPRQASLGIAHALWNRARSNIIRLQPPKKVRPPPGGEAAARKPVWGWGGGRDRLA